MSSFSIFKRANSFVVAMLFVASQIIPLIALGESVAADGNGSPDECLDTTTNVIGSVTGTDDLVSYDVGSGFVVDGVCIKSGSNMFGGVTHSDVLGNGTYEDDCYVVSGVGTQEVTVERIGSGPNCQGISHIDVVQTPAVTTGSISGYKWNDENGDGNTSGEDRIPGWTIFLDENANSILDNNEQSTVTDIDGNYSFTNLPLGSYTICEVQQNGWTQTYPDTNSGCRGTTLTDQNPNRSGKTYSFGNLETPTPKTTLTVTKFVAYENGGDKPATEFPVRVNGELLTPGPLQTFNNGNTATTFDTLDITPGEEFTLTEDEVSGYELRNRNCKLNGDTVGYPYTPSEGDAVACTLTNVDLPQPTVTVTKFVNNLYGGNKPANTFPVRVNGELLTPGQLVEPGNGNSFSTFETISVVAGEEFTITEDEVEDYELRNIVCKIDGQNIRPPFKADFTDEVLCNVVNDETPDFINVVATKIACTDESLLPNYGGQRGPNISALTAANWVTDNEGCDFVEGWNFEWALGSQKNPGDNVEVGGAGWSVFGTTNAQGVAEVQIDNLRDVNKLWFREQLQPGWLEFTGVGGSNVSAEFYCHRDVLNYDNYDFIKNFTLGDTYNCVAWNVELRTITATKYHDLNQNGTRDGSGEPRLNGWEMTVYRIGDNGREVVATGTTGDDGLGSVVFDNLLPDTYYVCETQKSGWMQTEPANEACIERDLTKGRDTVTRFGNIQYGRLKVNKIVRNNNGGTADPRQFGIEVDGEKYRFNQQGMVGVALLPGVYSVDEIEHEGYKLVRSNCEEVVVRPGKTTTCTLVNDDVAPKVIVKKCYRTTNPYIEQSFEFTIRNNGERYEKFNLAGRRCQRELPQTQQLQQRLQQPSDWMYMTGDDLKAGRVNIREDLPRNWSQTDVTCYERKVIETNERIQDVSLELDYLLKVKGFEPPFTAELGKTYVCEYENTERGKVVVTKFEDSNQNGEWDEGESSLENWDMTLTRQHLCTDFGRVLETQVILEDECATDEDRTRTRTTDENGEAVFRFVRPGVFTVDEVVQEGWEQTAIFCDPPRVIEREFSEQVLLSVDELQDYEQSDNQIRVRPGQTRYCYVGNYEIPVIETTLVSECGDDFPVVRWTVNANFVPTQFTLDWYTEDGNDAGDPADTLVTTQVFQASDAEVTYDSMTDTYEGLTLWPGADPSVPSWPGFELVNGQYVENPDVNFGNLRPGARVELTVNPTASSNVSYPPATPTCATDPSNPQVLAATTSTEPEELESTGAGVYGSLMVGLLLIGSVVFTRKQHTLAKQN